MEEETAHLQEDQAHLLLTEEAVLPHQAAEAAEEVEVVHRQVGQDHLQGLQDN
jgi:hypothetical protein